MFTDSLYYSTEPIKLKMKPLEQQIIYNHRDFFDRYGIYLSFPSSELTMVHKYPKILTEILIDTINDNCFLLNLYHDIRNQNLGWKKIPLCLLDELKSIACKSKKRYRIFVIMLYQ